MVSLTNSKITRVQPIFSWLQAHGGSDWPEQLLAMAHGIEPDSQCGAMTAFYLDPERAITPTPERLAWMLQNFEKLTPLDGRSWDVLRKRLASATEIENTLAKLAEGQTKGMPAKLVLEGKTHADCLIECERMFVWIEGKRFDWLSPGTTWDVTRDQIARNIEAVSSLARKAGKDYRLVICHEHALKHHETLLLDGYRGCTWTGGLPHVSQHVRAEMARRIGTLTWQEIVRHWPMLGEIDELSDLAS